MNNTFRKLAEEIQYQPTPAFNKVELIEAKLNENKSFDLLFKSPELIPFTEMTNFLSILNKNFKYKASPSFEITAVVPKLNEIKAYVSWVLDNISQKPYLSTIISNSKLVIEESRFIFEITSGGNNFALSAEKNTINRVMRKFGFRNFSFETKLIIVDDPLAKEAEDRKKSTSEFFQLQKDISAKVPTQSKSFTMGYQFVELDELTNSQLRKIIVKGKIFKEPEEFITKSGFKIVTYSITDYKDAVEAKQFINEKQIDKTEILKMGDYVTIKGNYAIDAYSGNPSISLNSIDKIENPFKLSKDESNKKRVELNVKTKMSAMDGLLTPQQIIDRAVEMGHSAIAVADVNSVQSFPNLYNYAKKKNIKPIFGATVTAIDRDIYAVYNPSDREIAKDKYVVFDLETTHLSPEFGEIIEFGAVIYSEGKEIKKEQFFIKPKKPISQFTTELTSITNDDLAEARSEEEEILRIKEILEYGVSVAHNAKFDLGFVNAKLAQYGHEELKTPVIDTLVIARYLKPDSKRFALGRVASLYDEFYDSSIAHRADYDAGVLGGVWMKMIKDLISKGITTIQQIADIRDSGVYAKSFSKNVTVLAKNQVGIKELFKLISKGSTEQFWRGPKLFIDEIKSENVLLGSGGLDSRLHDLIFIGNKSQIAKEISHYDYIELLPIQSFEHKIAKEYSKDFIEEILLFIYEEATRQKKIVVATGDVRYLSDREKIFYEVLINAKGIGGARHHLFNFRDKNPVYPTMTFLTTQEMIEQYTYLGDTNIIKQVVVDNTNTIADLIDEVQIIKDKLYTPIFQDDVKQLRELVLETAHAQYGNPLPQIVSDRIEKELKPIVEHGFGVIYWISHLLVAKSLQDGYLVGSRGSVGSSVIATFAKISEVNPLPPHYVCSKCKHSEFFPESTLNSGYDLDDKMCPHDGTLMDKDGQNIPFETFLGFNADKVPDIDLNFSGDYQPTIHAEVKKLFGEKHAFRAGTISTVAAKTAFGYVLGWAEETNRQNSRAFNELLAKGIEGVKRTTGQHPGGIIVIPEEYDVEDFSPVNYPANDINAAWQTTHFDFHAIHDNVLKLDLLGHDDPTAIKMLENLTNTVATDISFSDKKIISLFSSPEAMGIKPEDISGEPTGALGIPEFGTRFVRGMLKIAKVRSFGDLISVSGLSHGTNVWSNNAEDLVKTKGLQLSELISCRDDIMQALLLKKVDDLQSFLIMEDVRKGKGLTEAQEKLLKEHDVEDWYIESLKKIEYMFPKAHATAYVMMAWRIAFYKLYHPLAYYATYLTTRADNAEIGTFIKGKSDISERLKYLSDNRFMRGSGALSNKEISLIPVYEIIEEMLSRGFIINNISLEHSQANDWTIAEDGKSLYPPFTSVDGLGDSAALSVIEARKNGQFSSIKNLKTRTGLNNTNINVLKELGVLSNMDETDQLTFDLGI